HIKHVFPKEWLVKTNSATSQAYLMKFSASTDALTCCILMTDTVSCWGEVLTSAQFARRWRECNPDAEMVHDDVESIWRKDRFELICKTHSLGFFPKFNFEIVATKYSDIACILHADSFQWRWEMCFLGHKTSADVLSKQLVLPLISLSHVSFTSPIPMSEVSDANLEKDLDKTGRAARRTPDTHIRNVLSKPIVATSLRRLSAMFGSVPTSTRVVVEPHPVVSSKEWLANVEKGGDSSDSDVFLPPRKRPMRRIAPNTVAVTPQNPQTESICTCGESSKATPRPQDPGMSKPAPRRDNYAVSSATEDDGDGDGVAGPSNLPENPVSVSIPSSESTKQRKAEIRSSSDLDLEPVSQRRKLAPMRQMSSTDDDSDEPIRSPARQGTSGTTVKRGTRQPIKRGARRF
ncbi:hypothetical protein FISHEDRAFT_52553, partial [Fistulina hepatica ATCC 64428]